MDRLTNDRLQAIYREAVARGVATRGEHVPPERLHDLVARRGDESGRLADLDHVMGCATCRRGYELLGSIDAAREPEARWRRGVPLAAAAVAFLAVGVLTLRLRQEPAGDTMRDGLALPSAVSPAGDVDPGAARSFTWRAVTSASRYDLVVLDAAGTPIHTGTTTDTTYALPSHVPVTAGDYQWVVSAVVARGQVVVAPARAFRVR